MTPTLRLATVDDAAAIARVHLGTWQTGYAHVFPAAFLAGLDGALDQRTERWVRTLTKAAAPRATYVATAATDDDHAIIGFISLGPDREDVRLAEVYSFYVSAEYWSTGVGRALMDAAVAHFAAAGFTTVRLWTLEENPRARRFYERYGFTADGTSKPDTVDRDGPHATEVTDMRYVLAL